MKLTNYILILILGIVEVKGNIISNTFNFLADNTYCRYYECCTDEYVYFGRQLLPLSNILGPTKVYGQHLMTSTVVNAVNAHWDPEVQPSKPLVMSFHGPTGVGKNYAASMIVKVFFKNEFESSFVHFYIGRNDFPLESRVKEYKEKLLIDILSHMRKCPHQIFIFDEVDKIPSGVLDGIKSLIDYHARVNHVDMRRAIFIFICNAGHTVITQVLLKWWEDGNSREDLKLHHFEKLIAEGAFNDEGGFYESDTIKSNLIDHYVPFLPLEREHVIGCARDEFSRRNTDPTDEEMEEVLEFVEWGPPEHKIYAKTGCKRISQKVAMIIQQRRQRTEL